MAISTGNDGALAQRANLNIASAVVARLGMGASDSVIANVIHDVRASHSVAELASAGSISGLLGAVDTAIARNAETNRPHNDTDSRAAQLAALGGHHGGHWHGDGAAMGRYGLLAAGRGNRDTANDGGEGSGTSGSSTSRGNGGYAGTGNEPAGAPFWGTAKGMMLSRGYANDNHMDWAPPDLVRMGRPALQALKESGLKGEGYKALHAPSGLHFDNPTIVKGAAYMKRNHLNYDEAARAANKLYHHPSLNDDEHAEVRGASEQALQAGNDPVKGAAAKERIGKAQARINAAHPDAAKDTNAWARKFGGDKAAGLDAKAKAGSQAAAAASDVSRAQAARQKKDGAKAMALDAFK